MAIQEAVLDSRREAAASVENFDTIVIGGGQAGLSVGYYLKKQGRSFVILDANEQIGGSWRTRTWTSLRLFTPARYDGLPGWAFPAPGWSYPTARETADYLEAYAARFELPVRTGMSVDRLKEPCWVSLVLLNILSMRSVMRKPPTTFVEEQATARNPRTVLSGL